MAIAKASATAALLGAACLTIMVGCVIVPGLPAVASHLGVPSAASWLVTVPSLGVVLFGPVVGKLILGFGARNVLVAGLALYGALGYGGAWLEGYAAVFLDRLLLGGATAVVMAAGTTLISHLFDGDARLRMIARQGMAIELGGVIFLAVGGALASIGWDKPFLLYLFAWLLIPLTLYALPADRAGDDDADAVPAEDDFAVGDLKDIYAAAVFSMVIFFAGIILLPGKLSGIGLDEAEIGYFLSFISLVAVGAAFAMPHLITRFGDYRTVAIAFTCYAIAHAIFFAGVSVETLMIGAVFHGMGFGFSIPLVNHATIERSPARQRGRLLGYLSSAIFLGQFLSAFIEFAPVPRDASFAIASLIALVALGVNWGLKSA